MEELPNTEPVNISGTKAESGKKVWRTIGIVAAVVIVLALIGAGGYGLVRHPGFTAVLRDIFIIVLALVTIAIGLFLVILIFQLQSLIALLRDEIKPILESTNQTVSTVRGTTAFVSDAVVQPMITAAGYASAVRQTIKTLSGGSRRDRSRKARQQDSESA